MYKKAGFTLIELLVVIAIIAILVTIVIANVGTARGRARVVAAKATLKQVQVQAELESNGGAYSCSAGQIPVLIASALEKIGEDDSGASCSVGANGLAVDINAGLAAFGSEETYCVDTNGASGPGNDNGDGSCNPA